MDVLAVLEKSIYVINRFYCDKELVFYGKRRASSYNEFSDIFRDQLKIPFLLLFIIIINCCDKNVV